MLLQAEEKFDVVAEAGDVPMTERRVAAYRPRVLIFDLNTRLMTLSRAAGAGDLVAPGGQVRGLRHGQAQ